MKTIICQAVLTVSLGMAITTVKAQYSTDYTSAGYSSNSMNQVRSYTVLKPGMTISQINANNADPREVRLVTQYFDGLGRPMQTVVKQGSLKALPGKLPLTT